MIREFEIYDKHYGRVKYIDTGRYQPFSLIWYCIYCGIRYSKLATMDDGGGLQPYKTVEGCCEECQQPVERIRTRLLIPGSIWHYYSDEYNKLLPGEVLERELELHLKSLEAIDYE